MAVEKIVEKIIQDAKNKADVILKEADLSVNEILLESSKNAQVKKLEILSKRKEEAESKKRMELIRMQMRLKQELLDLKRDLLDSVFEDAKEEFKNIKKDKHREFYRSLLLRSIVSGSEDICISVFDKQKMDEDFWKDIEQELIRKGIHPELNIIIDNSIDMGFIVKGKKVFTDCRISSIISSIKEKIETESASVLFEPFEK
ncbi:hypothetical protein B9J78_02030 [bacterium Unc6]|nr:hypothetical protein [bacterium Unc6]